MRFSIVTLVLVVAAASLQAQQYAGVSAWYEPFPERQFEVTGAFPIMLNERQTVFVNRVSYQYTEYDFEEWNFNESGVEDTEIFHTILYNLTYTQRLSEKWRLLFMVKPSLSSDFESALSYDDFYLTLRAGFLVQILENLSLGLAVVYSLGFPFPYPMGTVQWNITDNIQLMAQLPKFASLQLTINKYLDLGVAAEVDSRSHHADPDKYGINNPQLRYIAAKTGPFARLNITDWLHLNVDGGYYFYRQFTLSDGTEQRESINPDGLFYLQAGLVVGK